MSGAIKRQAWQKQQQYICQNVITEHMNTSIYFYIDHIFKSEDSESVITLP